MAVLRRLAQGEVLLKEDFVEIADRLASGGTWNAPPLMAGEMPGSNSGRRQVAVRCLRVNHGVNALIDGEGLDVPPEGITVVYGDNGSGKSGFARLLKDVSRARHRESVLSNIFAAEDGQSPEAEVVISVDGVDQAPGVWPGAVSAQVQQVGFFDEACGDAYLATESEVTFRPAGIFLLDGLIRACDEVRREIDQRLSENQMSVESLPTISSGGDAERFLRGLSAETTVEEILAACKAVAEAEDELERLSSEEARLRSSDPIQERRRLTSLAGHFETVGRHLDALKAQLSPAAISALVEVRESARQLRAIAAAASGRSFENEPVAGVGTQAWRSLWEAARVFAGSDAGVGFPEGARNCVLCQQELAAEAVERFGRFEQSVRDETEQNASAAERRAQQLTQGIARVTIKPAEVLAAVEQLSVVDQGIVTPWRLQLDRFETVRASLDDLPACLVAAEHAATGSPGSAAAVEKAESLRTEAAGIDSSQHSARLSAISDERRSIKDSLVMAGGRTLIEREVERLRQRRVLETAKRSTDTTGTTRKATELTRSHVTTLVRDRFTRESDRLRLERVTLEDTGGQKGRLQHRPAFVGAVQQPAMSSVLSEGEQTALGLAGFFTEAHLDESCSSIVLDDPVSSLDHIRRGRVAARLAELAADRQVIVFTHDLAFVADLARAASEAEVPLAERSVERHGNGRPGVCSESHPWKTKDVKARLGTLEVGLASIGREMGDWGQERREKEVADWAGKLSETWERMLSSELVGRVLDRSTMEVRPRMLKVLARLTEEDDKEFQESYGRISRWARRHDKSLELNYVAPTVEEMRVELALVRNWHDRVRKYGSN